MRPLPLADDLPGTRTTAVTAFESRAARDPSVPARPLAELLAERTVPAVLVGSHASGALTCLACAHGCVVDVGRTGACGVRTNAGGVLRVPFGYVARRYVRSVETNTIFHVRPGARALTFGMFGCDLRCPYCHNWRVSQALREGLEDDAPIDTTADELIELAVREECTVVCAAYNEPLIAAEWIHAVFSSAKARGLTTAVISDGNTTPDVLAYLRPVTDVFRVDLKGFSNEQYKVLGGRLAPVLDGIREAKRLGYWVEVVTLVVPGLNDDLDGLRSLARALVEIDPSIPWHLNAFRPHYKLGETPATGGMFLAAAAGIAYARGLSFVYVGNVPDDVSELSHTRCPSCMTTVVERRDYATTRSTLGTGGTCPSCATVLPGLWG